MASIIKLSSGKFRAMVARQGVRKSKVFPTRQAAKDWAARQEHLILDGAEQGGKTTLAEACIRYAREVSPLRRGERWESIRLNRFAGDDIAQKRLSDLKPLDFANWRDRRLLDVKPATVAREMNLLSSVLTQCRREWGLIATNPLSDVRKPQKPPPRNRTATEAEMEALALSAGPDLSNATARAFHAFRFACETAMRAGEITGLTSDRVFVERRFLHLPMTKNGHARDVPLSGAALELLAALPESDLVFDLDPRSLDVLWRKLRDRAAVKGLTFHDSRRMGTIKLSKKLEPLELAKVTGHRDLNMLLNTYFKADISGIAGKLD